MRFRSGDAHPPILLPQHPSLLPADRDGTAKEAEDILEGAARTAKMQRQCAADSSAAVTAAPFQDALDNGPGAKPAEGAASSSLGTMQYCVAEAEATFLSTLFNLSPSDLSEAASPEPTQPVSACRASLAPCAAGARATGDKLHSDRGAAARALLQKALSSMRSLHAARISGHKPRDGEALSLASGIQTQLEDLAREQGLGDRRQGAEGRECVMCLQDESEVSGWGVLLPCGHACVCRTC